VRDPLEVAASLTKRNGLPTLTGLALWAHYNRTMLRDLHGARVHLCNYADLVENPGAVLSAIVDSLRAWGEVPVDIDLARATASIHPELRRNTIVDEDFVAEASPLEINELMKLTLDQRGRHDAFDMGTVLEPGWWEGPLLEERRLLLQWALARISELEMHSANLLTENGILWQQSEAATREIDQLRERLEQLERLSRLVPGPLRRVASKMTR
jgi:hypothetical protein